MTEKVKYTELLPFEFRKRLEDRPIAYLPLGTLEWHGEHIALGADAIQSEGLMIRCARQLGGIVLPPIHLGPDRALPTGNGSFLYGMDYADTTTPRRQLDGSCYWVAKGFFKMIVDSTLVQVKRAGFQAVFADGHGPSRKSWVEDLEEREVRLGMKLLGVTQELRELGWDCQTDHAAKNETSIMMALRPDLVDLSRLPEDRDVWPQGVGGKDPRDASAEYGETCLSSSLEALEKLLEKRGV